ncbi:MAG: NAD(P)H-dependent oxidoreductase subunit E [Gemmatimonadota bacterium]
MSLIQALERLQTERGHLSPDSLRELAATLRAPLYRLQELVSFYPHFRTEPPADVTVSVCRDVSCHLAGADGLKERLEAVLDGDGRVRVESASCLGCCERAPAGRVNGLPCRLADPEALAAALAGGADPAEAAEAAARAGEEPGAGGRPEAEALPTAGPEEFRCDPYGEEPEARYGALRELLVAVGPNGGPGGTGGAAALDAGLEALLAALEESGLRGMGGAGFPTGRKWRLVRAEPAAPKYVVCNADESEPGTFKDRVVLERLPHLVVEGMILGGLAVGAERGIVYLRHEYGAAREALEAEIRRAREAGWVGEDVGGAGRAFELEVFLSPGGYILGEETALLEALEDRRGEPRNKPPFPGQHGLHGKPTLINNVETFAYVPAIARRGADWWRAQGADGHAGLKCIAVSGHVERPGVYEIPTGTTVAALIDLAGGVSGGRALKAFAPGGASSRFLPPGAADTPIDFHTLAEAGSMMGSGALVVVAEGTPLLPVAANVVRFFRDESCGKCVPCRDGTEKAVAMVEAALAGEPLDRETIDKLNLLLTETSICGLGYVALNPLLSVAEHWPEEVPFREVTHA